MALGEASCEQYGCPPAGGEEGDSTSPTSTDYEEPTAPSGYEPQEEVAPGEQLQYEEPAPAPTPSETEVPIRYHGAPPGVDQMEGVNGPDQPAAPEAEQYEGPDAFGSPMIASGSADAAEAAPPQYHGVLPGVDQMEGVNGPYDSSTVSQGPETTTAGGVEHAESVVGEEEMPGEEQPVAEDAAAGETPVDEYQYDAAPSPAPDSQSSEDDSSGAVSPEEQEAPSDWDYEEDPQVGEDLPGPADGGRACYDVAGEKDPYCGLDVPPDYRCSVHEDTVEGTVRVCGPVEEVSGEDYESGAYYRPCSPVTVYDMDEGEKLGDYTVCQYWKEPVLCGEDNCGVKEAPPEGWECATIQRDYGTLYEEQGKQIVCVDPEYWNVCPGHDTYNNPTVVWIYDEDGNLVSKDPCSEGDGNYAFWLADNADPADDALSGGHDPDNAAQGPEGVWDGPGGQRPDGGRPGEVVQGGGQTEEAVGGRRGPEAGNPILEAGGGEAETSGGPGAGPPVAGISEAGPSSLRGAPASVPGLIGYERLSVNGITDLGFLDPADVEVQAGAVGGVGTVENALRLRSARASVVALRPGEEADGELRWPRGAAVREPVAQLTAARDQGSVGDGGLAAPAPVKTSLLAKTEDRAGVGDRGGRGPGSESADGRRGRTGEHNGGWAGASTVVPLAALGVIGAVLFARNRYAA